MSQYDMHEQVAVASKVSHLPTQLLLPPPPPPPQGPQSCGQVEQDSALPQLPLPQVSPPPPPQGPQSCWQV